MKPDITVFGGQSDGQAMAADLTLAGYKVNLLELPENEKMLKGVEKQGGIHLEGEQTRSGKTGFAKPNMVTTDAEKALEDVDVIFLTNPVTNYEKRIEHIAEFLEDGQILNFNTYGYWPSLRVAKYLEKEGMVNIVLTESPAPIYMSAGENGRVVSKFVRNNVPLASFPANKTKALNVLKEVFPSYELVENVLQTNLENINMMVHPGITVLNIGWYDRAERKGEKVEFYQIGNTKSTGLLQEALDDERMKICEAYKVRVLTIHEHLNRYYGVEGDNMYEITRNCKPYQQLRPLPSDIWIRWITNDIRLAVVPLVQLAELAGVSIPISKGIVDIIGAVLEENFWKTGLTLNKIGLDGLNVDEIKGYVDKGKK